MKTGMLIVAGTLAVLGNQVGLARDLATCGEQWSALEAEGTAISLGPNPTGPMAGTIVVVTNASAWGAMDFAAKSALADTYNCAMLGEDQFDSIEFISNMTNNRLGLWLIGSGLEVVE